MSVLLLAVFCPISAKKSRPGWARGNAPVAFRRVNSACSDPWKLVNMMWRSATVGPSTWAIWSGPGDVARREPVEGLLRRRVEEVDAALLLAEVRVLILQQLLGRVGRVELHRGTRRCDRTGEVEQRGQSVGVDHQHAIDVVASHGRGRARVELRDDLSHVRQVR